jgi:oligoribonuclease (3'-5' exoribonuclease)
MLHQLHLSVHQLDHIWLDAYMQGLAASQQTVFEVGRITCDPVACM